MDQRATVVEQDIKAILATRLEISRKLQMLDYKVRGEFQHMKGQWFGLAGTVAETGTAFVTQFARMQNVGRQVTTRPWAVFAGMVFFGVAIGMVDKRVRRPKIYSYYPPNAHGVPVMPPEGERQDRPTQSGVYPYFPGRPQQAERGGSSFLSDLVSDVRGGVGAELHRSQDVIGYILREFVRAMAKAVVSAILRSMAPALSHGPRR